MPRRFERHRRAKPDWESPPSRSAEAAAVVGEQQLADIEKTRRAPGRKDTRSWCRGKAGAEHVLRIVLAQDTPGFREHACRWVALWGLRERNWVARWRCGHREVCVNCGRVFREDLHRDECPVYPGSAGEKDAAEAEAAVMAARHRAWWAGRHQPLITGPQGYRKPRTGRRA